MKYFDSHAHYYDARFNDEISESVDQLIGALFSSTVSYIINVGTSPETSRAAIEQARAFPNMYTAIGIHPSDCQYLGGTVEENIAAIEELILDPQSKCVAIGEIGFDYHYPDTNKELQAQYFDAQMRLAKKLALPVVIHDRDSHEDTLEMIKKHPEVRGVLHSFSGSAEMAREIVKLGYMISVSGTVTFKNARKPKEVVAAIPKEYLMIETDCPYLAPHPHRGSINHSGYLSYTNSQVAELLGITDEAAAELTENNARRFFGLL